MMFDNQCRVENDPDGSERLAYARWKAGDTLLPRNIAAHWKNPPISWLRI